MLQEKGDFSSNPNPPFLPKPGWIYWNQGKVREREAGIGENLAWV